MIETNIDDETLAVCFWPEFADSQSETSDRPGQGGEMLHKSDMRQNLSGFDMFQNLVEEVWETKKAGRGRKMWEKGRKASPLLFTCSTAIASSRSEKCTF